MNKIYSVSELNHQVKNWLEHEIGRIEVTGEISNLARPASGHLYFSLKDAKAQVRCALFRNYQSAFTSQLSDGQQVILNGHLSLYEPRGEYQLIAYSTKPAGEGLLLRQFQEVKDKLHKEGLFDTALKRPLPRYPKTIGIITSSTGAALQDMITTISRRYPLTKVCLYPSEVQGSNAPQSLQNALRLAIDHQAIDVLIIGRGGGSIEDLQAFNDEALARMIRKTPFPVVSAVGHETDFTIVDFVADLRAPTPTGAAEAVTPDQKDLLQHLQKDLSLLIKALTNLIQQKQWLIERLHHRLNLPIPAIQLAWQRLDHAQLALNQLIQKQFQIARHRLQLLSNTIHSLNPCSKLSLAQKKLEQLQDRMLGAEKMLIKNWHYRLQITCSTLHAVSPLATLDRGYSISSFNNKVLYNSQDVKLNDQIEVRLKNGRLSCSVINIMENENV